MRQLLLVLALGFGMNINSPRGFAQPAKHVIIIAIDGFRADFYENPKWNMVNLRAMKEAGVSAKGVTSIFPSVTFPNHTSIITGARAGEHGIYANAPMSEKGEAVEWYWYEKDIQVPTLWDAVKSAGRTTASVNWPVSVGGPIDYNIPIIKKPGRSQLEVVKENTYPAGLFEEAEKYATGILEEEDITVEGTHLAMDQNVARLSAYLIRKYKPALTTLRLSCTDHFEHEEGREGNKVAMAVSGADNAIRTVLEAVERAGIKESTAVIVTGDHGFVNRHTSLSPNIWLRELGLMNSESDWKARFYSAGGSAFLRIKSPEDNTTQRKVMEMLNELPSTYRKLFRIVDREKLDEVGADPKSFLALAATPGFVFSSSISGELVRPVSGGTHGYFPDFKDIQTGFVGYGAGFRQGVILEQMELTDIAPIVAALLGLDFKTKKGAVYPGLISR